MMTIRLAEYKGEGSSASQTALPADFLAQMDQLKREVELLKSQLAQVGSGAPVAKSAPARPQTVSYTHLDVYKRQVITPKRS